MAPETVLLVGACGIFGFVAVWRFAPSRPATAKASTSKDWSPPPAAEEHHTRPSWCDILLVEPNAGQAEIRRSYVRLMKSIHPDSSGLDAAASLRCSKVKDAYERATSDAQVHGRA